MIKANNDQYFPALTGIRAIAAYMVFLHHYLPFSKEQIGITAFYMVWELHIGVTLFFVLSGFLIAYRYIDIPEFNFRNYIVNRVARIYPMYLILTTFTFAWLAWRAGENTKHDFLLYLLNISFLRGFFNDFKFSGISQGWSLTVEETFYFMAPLFFLLIRKMKGALLLLPGLLIGFGCFMVFQLKDLHWSGFFGSMEFMFNYTFFGRCCEFFVGITLALMYKKYSGNRKGQYFTYSGIMMIIVCLYLLSQVEETCELGMRLHMEKVIKTLILPVFGISVFYYGLLTEKTFVSKLLSTKQFVLLGKSSYVFYLIHMGVFGWIILKFNDSILLLFVILNIISILFFLYLEEPLNHYLRRRLKRQQVLN